MPDRKQLESGAAMKLFHMLAAFVLAVSPSLAAPQATVTGGRLEGIQQGSINAFLGVPFAAPPAGPNRWRPPQPVEPWSGVRSAAQFGANCIQAPVPDKGFGPWTPEYLAHGATNEDCLFLNVWTPPGQHRLPVLVWIHGGGFNQGSGSVPVYDGAPLAAQGIVVVTINYRLSALGFLAHPGLSAESPDHVSGNYGVLDAVAALKWVRDNIAAFGGDPAQVTIAGQSAGAAMVLDLDISPLAKGLYARAIAESGAGLGFAPPSLHQAEEIGGQYAAAKGATSVEALRKLPAADFVPGLTEGLRFGPIADGIAVPGAPQDLIAQGRMYDVPFLTGLTADEASGMDPKYGAMTPQECVQFFTASGGARADQLRALYLTGPDCSAGVKAFIRDRGLVSTYLWAQERRKAAKQPVFIYYYDHTEPGPDSAHYGAFHSSEMPYVFRTLDKSPERSFTAGDRQIMDTVSAYWVNFIKTGNPNGAGLPPWPQADALEKPVMRLGDGFEARPVTAPDKLKTLQDLITSGRAGLF